MGETPQQAVVRKLVIALDGKGAFRRFKDVLHEDDDFLQRWYLWESENVLEAMYAWFKQLNIREEPDRWDGYPCCASHGDEDVKQEFQDEIPF